MQLFQVFCDHKQFQLPYTTAIKHKTQNFLDLMLWHYTQEQFQLLQKLPVTIMSTTIGRNLVKVKVLMFTTVGRNLVKVFTK